MNAEITLRLKIGKITHELTVAEAQALRDELNKALGEPAPVLILRDPIYPNSIPWNPYPVISYGTGTPTFQPNEITCRAIN